MTALQNSAVLEPPAVPGTDWAQKRIFTTGEASDVCKVSQQTIIRCFDSGRLGGFRVPGSKFRRIPRNDLLKFMRENDIPTEALEGKRQLCVLNACAVPQLELLDKITRIEPTTTRVEVDTHLFLADLLTGERSKAGVIIGNNNSPNLQNLVDALLKKVPNAVVLVISETVRVPPGHASVQVISSQEAARDLSSRVQELLRTP